MANRLILAVLVSVLLSGCAPVLSNQITREADGKIAFPDLMTQPDRFRGAVVILGGQIIETVAKENETLVQVLQLPLGDRQQPDHRAAPQGRFLVVYPYLHSSGLNSGILACMMRGATNVPHAVFDVPSFGSASPEP